MIPINGFWLSVPVSLVGMYVCCMPALGVLLYFEVTETGNQLSALSRYLIAFSFFLLLA